MNSIAIKGIICPILTPMYEDESINEQDPSLVTGRMSNNTLVHFKGDASLIGTLQNVYLDECRGFYYMGTPVENN